MQKYKVDERGYYGEFGGAYIPEILHKCVTDLKKAYLGIIESEKFQSDFKQLLNDYVGRPSPLYHSKQLSERYGRSEERREGKSVDADVTGVQTCALPILK